MRSAREWLEEFWKRDRSPDASPSGLMVDVISEAQADARTAALAEAAQTIARLTEALQLVVANRFGATVSSYDREGDWYSGGLPYEVKELIREAPRSPWRGGRGVDD